MVSILADGSRRENIPTNTTKHFLTETDFAVAARWGLDHVRIPVDYELVETEGGIQKESGFQWIAQCITWCRKYGLHMILDLHKTAGYTFDDPIHSDEFFHQPGFAGSFHFSVAGIRKALRQGSRCCGI